MAIERPEMQQPSSQTLAQPVIYSVRQACELTHAGRTTLYAAIKAGQLRAVKRGRSTLLLREDLLRWVGGFPSIRELRPATKFGDRHHV
jgi:excisionase family DNA binding protein